MKWFLIIWILTPLGPMTTEIPQDSEPTCIEAVAKLDFLEKHRWNKHAIIYGCREREVPVWKPEPIDT